MLIKGQYDVGSQEIIGTIRNGDGWIVLLKGQNLYILTLDKWCEIDYQVKLSNSEYGEYGALVPPKRFGLAGNTKLGLYSLLGVSLREYDLGFSIIDFVWHNDTLYCLGSKPTEKRSLVGLFVYISGKETRHIILPPIHVEWLKSCNLFIGRLGIIVRFGNKIKILNTP